MWQSFLDSRYKATVLSVLFALLMLLGVTLHGNTYSTGISVGLVLAMIALLGFLVAGRFAFTELMITFRQMFHIGEYGDYVEKPYEHISRQQRASLKKMLAQAEKNNKQSSG